MRVVFSAFAWLACLACQQERPTREPLTLVLSAFEGELSPMLAAASSTEELRRDGRTYVIGTIENRRVVLALSGVGVDAARRSTTAALDAFDVRAIVFVGIAGGLDPGLGIGDVVVPAQWGRHDAGTEPTWTAVDSRLAALGPTLDSGVGDDFARCSDAACAAAPRIHRGGRGVTGTRFIADPAYAAELWRRHAARIVDMETSVVAEVAAAQRIPFLGVRGVSDMVETGASRDLIEQFWPIAATNAARTATAWIAALPR